MHPHKAQLAQRYAGALRQVCCHEPTRARPPCVSGACMRAPAISRHYSVSDRCIGQAEEDIHTYVADVDRIDPDV